jgi:hypothetical protein
MSHHYSGPDWGFPHGDARLDLTDLYAFPKPGDAGKSMRIPRRWINLRPRLERRAAELVQVLEREPTVPELAERLGVSEEDVTGELGVREFYRLASLDARAI